MSEHEKEIQELISHFNERLSSIASEGGNLTPYEQQLMKRLDNYTRLLENQINVLPK